MTTHFISAEIDLAEDPADLPTQVETELEKRGKPLRWEIVNVNQTTRKAHIEAVVTQKQ
ncbi:MAG: hypothetical protein ACFBSG_18615 [Leptolyngbyaceae cyanobacterium]